MPKTKCKLPKMSRFHFIDLMNRASVRTFNKQVYQLKQGLLVQNTTTSEVKRLTDIYYEIRTVRDKKGNVLAKRKNPNSELYKII
ncbi:hypothetical protein [Heyndrickxia camelliae]|uniref:Uncharacterized protein n=1 Tax=Heyndrickxia camelliae TaxID=1707093 RepID=A0A2N3LEK2_9BACI|nr:hypothetical protein [Heyndrickxia camelliae]PKR83060.1 hypothetical protein CWO92_21220 [Heyndrickxia camelliae]